MRLGEALLTNGAAATGIDAGVASAGLLVLGSNSKVASSLLLLPAAVKRE